MSVVKFASFDRVPKKRRKKHAGFFLVVCASFFARCQRRCSHTIAARSLGICSGSPPLQHMMVGTGTTALTCRSCLPPRLRSPAARKQRGINLAVNPDIVLSNNNTTVTRSKVDWFGSVLGSQLIMERTHSFTYFINKGGSQLYISVVSLTEHSGLEQHWVLNTHDTRHRKRQVRVLQGR